MPSKTIQAPDAPVTDASAVLQYVLPSFLTALQAVSEKRADAGEVVEPLLQQIDQDAEQAEGEAKEFWLAVARVLRMVLVDQPGPMPLIDAVEEWEDKPEDGWKVVCTLCYIGASVDQRAVPTLQIAIHMTIAEFLYDATHEDAELYEGVVLPWFETFWKQVFGEARFRFTSPRMVETALNASLESPTDVRLQRLLGAIGFGLNVTLPDEGKNWFQLYTG
jgi:hypothetical protein